MTIGVLYDDKSRTPSALLEKARERVGRWYDDRLDRLYQLEDAQADTDAVREHALRTWREMQGFGRVFSRSPMERVKFNSLAQPLRQRLVPMLVDLPSFNADPRFVENKADYKALNDAVEEYLGTPVALTEDRLAKVQAIADRLWRTNHKRLFLFRLDEATATELQTLLGDESADVLTWSPSQTREDELGTPRNAVDADAKTSPEEQRPMLNLLHLARIIERARAISEVPG